MSGFVAVVGHICILEWVNYPQKSDNNNSFKKKVFEKKGRGQWKKTKRQSTKGKEKSRNYKKRHLRRKQHQCLRKLISYFTPPWLRTSKENIQNAREIQLTSGSIKKYQLQKYTKIAFSNSPPKKKKKKRSFGVDIGTIVWRKKWKQCSHGDQEECEVLFSPWCYDTRLQTSHTSKEK